MTLVLIRPGNLTPPLNLLQVLRERHEESSAFVDRKIAARKAAGATDAVDWSVVGPALKEAEDAHTAAAVLAAVRKIAAACAEVVEPLAAFDEPPGLGGVDVVFRALAEEERDALIGAVAIAGLGVEAAEKSEGQGARISGVLVANQSLQLAKGALVKAAVASVRIGGGPVADVDDDLVAALRATGAGVFDWLYVAARDYQGLSSGKGNRFGAPPQRT